MEFALGCSCEQRSLLFKNGADVNLKGKQDLTPLHWAVAVKKTGMFQLLIQNGADVNIQSKKSESLLH